MGGRVALSVYSAIEQTPAADAFARALDKSLGVGASTIERSEHVFRCAKELSVLLIEQGFQ